VGREIEQTHPVRLDRPVLNPSPPTLPLRVAAPAWVALSLACVIAWWLTLRDIRSMAGMPGMGLTMGRPLLGFVAMWTLMMAAMMLPSVGPMASVWLRSIAREARPRVRVLRVGLFCAGYVLAWGATGAVAYALCRSIDAGLTRTPSAAPWIAAGVFAAAGGWQLSPWKDACLRHCRSPLASLAHYASWRGPLLDLRVGGHHGLFCIGCCAGLMLVLLATGVMHLSMMVALTAVVLLEKVWRHGAGLGRIAGLALLAAACAAPFWPALRPGLVE
jgi:predicted metal-binding membrane protein